MRKIYVIITGVLFAAALVWGVARAQVEPPVNLPIVTISSTPTPSSGVITYLTVTPGATATVANQQFVDDAQTGSQIYFLAFFSLVAGIGLFFIKKYFDIKRYSI